jgi:predicted anti-sigma-YlaC factor YlaD
MNHDELRILISSFVDGEVTDEEKKDVLAHLEVCSECRIFLKQMKQLHAEIRNIDPIELPNAFTENVTHLAMQQDEQTAEWFGIEPLARNTFLALTVVVLILFFLTSSNNGTNRITSDQLLGGNTTDSIATQVLLQQDDVSKSDLLYAAFK